MYSPFQDVVGGRRPSVRFRKRSAVAASSRTGAAEPSSELAVILDFTVRSRQTAEDETRKRREPTGEPPGTAKAKKR